ncbi:MAG: sulfite exporter TauE/SafE family protein [Termitinemataceae bacterium]|nr:MAG: sulfite exporter TauE/SafE family protein [Termitinemataceae bacterium]
MYIMKKDGMQTVTLRIGGMTCVNCQTRIEKALRECSGVSSAVVDFSARTASISFDGIETEKIKTVIEDAGYKVLDGSHDAVRQAISTIIIIFSLYIICRHFGIGNLSGNFPLAESTMGYGALFLIGLLTSLHCVAMCGGINLSQCIPTAANKTALNTADNQIEVRSQHPNILMPCISYNGGRVVSYTLVGGIVGAIGSVLTVSGTMQGLVQLIAGVFMLVMGVKMLGIFPPLCRFNLHLPKFLSHKIDSAKSANKNPFIVGLLNALMPCGPLQAMQLYALSTGNALSGAISMFAFSAGTVPLMFALGSLSSFLSKKWSAKVMKAGAVLVSVFGLTMFTNGWNLAGINFSVPLSAQQRQNTTAPYIPVVENGIQVVNSTLSGGRYPAITVAAGTPVKWTIDAPQGSINGCNNRMIIREYGIEHQFKTGANVIEFTPARTGKFTYTCWMGMIRSSITVVEPGADIADLPDDDTIKSANVQIPTDNILIAKTDANGLQTAELGLTDSGFDSAVIILERNKPTLFNINNNSLDSGNSGLIFPAYFTQLDIKNGDNVIQLIPQDDFDFSTIDNIFYAYVKVVDDINKIDLAAIKTEIGNYETKIYPDSYFDQSNSGMSCCR